MNEVGWYIRSMNWSELKADEVNTVQDALHLSGALRFKGTRVPVSALFQHLEAGVSIEEFMEDFPGVAKEQILAVLEQADWKMSISA